MGRVAAQHVDRSRSVSPLHRGEKPLHVSGALKIFAMQLNIFVIYESKRVITVSEDLRWSPSSWGEAAMETYRVSLAFFCLFVFLASHSCVCCFCSIQTKKKQKCTGSYNIKHTVCDKHNAQDVVRARSLEAACGSRSVQDKVWVQEQKQRQSKQEVFELKSCQKHIISKQSHKKKQI